LLGARPTVALVNEQAYSAGLGGTLSRSGYAALLMTGTNPSPINPEWDAGHQHLRNIASGLDGRQIALLGPTPPPFSNCNGLSMTTSS